MKDISHKIHKVAHLFHTSQKHPTLNFLMGFYVVDGAIYGWSRKCLVLLTAIRAERRGRNSLPELWGTPHHPGKGEISNIEMEAQGPRLKKLSTGQYTIIISSYKPSAWSCI